VRPWWRLSDGVGRLVSPYPVFSELRNLVPPSLGSHAHPPCSGVAILSSMLVAVSRIHRASSTTPSSVPTAGPCTVAASFHICLASALVPFPADRLAKEATKQKPRTATKTSLAYLKRMARLRMREEWRRWWDTTEQKGHEYFGQFRGKPDKIFEMDIRSLISTVTQLRTGHGYFNSYLQRIPTPN